MSDQLYRFVKASERLPEIEYDKMYIVKIGDSVTQFHTSVIHTIERKDFEWLEPVPPADQDKMRELELFKYKLPAQSEDGWRYDYDFINDLTQAVRGNQYAEGVDMETVEAVLLELHNRAMSLLSSTSDGWIRVEDGLPDDTGYYICWCDNEPGLIHYHKETGWQNGFYNDIVTHWKIILPPSPNQTIKK